MQIYNQLVLSAQMDMWNRILMVLGRLRGKIGPMRNIGLGLSQDLRNPLQRIGTITNQLGMWCIGVGVLHVWRAEEGQCHIPITTTITTPLRY